MFLSVSKLVRVYCNQYFIPSSRVCLINRTRLSSDRKRFIYTTQCLRHGEYEWQDPKSEAEVVRVHFVDKNGKRTEVKGKIGDNVLYLAHRLIKNLLFLVLISSM